MNTLDITPRDHTTREAFAAHNPDLLTDGMLRSIAAETLTSDLARRVVVIPDRYGA